MNYALKKREAIKTMKIAIGCDHAGPALKAEVLAHLDERGIAYKDFGVQEGEKVDYPDKAEEVCKRVADGEYDMGILICGTGIGMSMAANKVKGIRAACCSDYFSAKYTRAHNDANVLCIGARVLGAGLAIELVDVFLDTQFEGGRHQRRVDKITALEG
jgi:ribose 5-phosphate isomerase B